MAFAIGCFKPGTFLCGHTHTEALSKVTADRKYLPSDEQYDRMITEGLGDLDKSGAAELTFKDRHKHSGDRA
jgi:hypothetical protein